MDNIKPKIYNGCSKLRYLLFDNIDSSVLPCVRLDILIYNRDILNDHINHKLYYQILNNLEIEING